MATYTTLVGNEVASPTLPRSQVYKATHEEGGKRLPFMYRSFISFTYGGKHIEDCYKWRQNGKRGICRI